MPSMDLSRETGLQNVNYRFDWDLKGSDVERTSLRDDELLTRSEELSPPSIARDAKRTMSKTMG